MRFEVVIIGRPDDAAAAQAAVDAIVAALPEGWQTIAAPWRKSLSDAGRDMRIKVVGRTVDEAAADAVWATLKPAIPEGFRATVADYEQDFAVTVKAQWAAQLAAERQVELDATQAIEDARIEADRPLVEKVYAAIETDATLDAATRAKFDALVAAATKAAKVVPEPVDPEPIGEVEK